MGETDDEFKSEDETDAAHAAAAEDVASGEDELNPVAAERSKRGDGLAAEETRTDDLLDEDDEDDEDDEVRLVEAEAEPIAAPDEVVVAPVARATVQRGAADTDLSDIQYARRASSGDRQDRGWWVEDDYLVESDGGGRLRRVHLGDVLEVQVAPAPAKFRPWRHQTVLGLRDSRRIAIDNAHFVGTANYEDRSATYAPFVRGLIDRIVEIAPYAKARRGASYLGYVAMLAFVIVLIALVAVLLFMLPIDGVPGIAFIKLGLVALMAPPLFLWVAKSRPTGMPLADLPAGALPRARRPGRGVA